MSILPRVDRALHFLRALEWVGKRLKSLQGKSRNTVVIHRLRINFDELLYKCFRSFTTLYSNKI